MKLCIRKDIFDSVCDSLGIEKAYKYIRRYKKGDDYVYVYPKNVKAKNRTGAKKELTEHVPIIQGLQPLYEINEKNVEYYFNELRRLSSHGELVCPALGRDNILINETSKKHQEETNGKLRIPEAKNHKQRYLPFIADILKHGKLIEKSKNGKQTTYGIGGKVKYFDKLRETKIYEDVINRIKINPNFDQNKKYNLLILGEAEKEDQPTTFDIYNSEMTWKNTWAPFVMTWNAYEFFNFYEKKPYIIKMNWSNDCNPITDEEVKTLDTDYLLNKALPYPHKNSTFVDNNVIYIVFEQNKLDELKNRINEIKQTN